MLGIPAVLATLQPGWVPTSEFPCPMVPLPRVPRFLNRATYLTVSATLSAYNGVVNTWRADSLGLARGRGPEHALVLQAFSSAVTPVDPAWPETVRTTGFWFLPRNPGWAPDTALSAFLEAGPPPVYIGFGSMAGRDAERTGDIVAQAVRQAGVRAIVATGWGGLAARSSGDILVIDQAPHDWLFGARWRRPCTTAAEAPLPRLWRQQCRRSSARSSPTNLTGHSGCTLWVTAASPHDASTAGSLGEAITQAVSDPKIRQRAIDLGEQIRAENGVQHCGPRPGGDPQWTSLTASRGPSA